MTRITSDQLDKWLRTLRAVTAGRPDPIDLEDVHEAMQLALGDIAPAPPFAFPDVPPSLTDEEMARFVSSELTNLVSDLDAGLLTATTRPAAAPSPEDTDAAIRSWMAALARQRAPQSDFDVIQLLDDLSDRLSSTHPVKSEDGRALVLKVQLLPDPE